MPPVSWTTKTKVEAPHSNSGNALFFLSLFWLGIWVCLSVSKSVSHSVIPPKIASLDPKFLGVAEDNRRLGKGEHDLTQGIVSWRKAARSASLHSSTLSPRGIYSQERRERELCVHNPTSWRCPIWFELTQLGNYLRKGKGMGMGTGELGNWVWGFPIFFQYD